MLNGLERFGVGWQSGLYDIGTITRLGGGIVVKTYRKYESYISEARQQNPRAFRALVLLEAEIKRYQNRGAG